jgi:hypothetical protein
MANPTPSSPYGPFPPSRILFFPCALPAFACSVSPHAQDFEKFLCSFLHSNSTSIHYLFHHISTIFTYHFTHSHPHIFSLILTMYPSHLLSKKHYFIAILHTFHSHFTHSNTSNPIFTILQLHPTTFSLLNTFKYSDFCYSSTIRPTSFHSSKWTLRVMLYPSRLVSAQPPLAAGQP